jgi:hypothetical protein
LVPAATGSVPALRRVYRTVTRSSGSAVVTERETFETWRLTSLPRGRTEIGVTEATVLFASTASGTLPSGSMITES